MKENERESFMRWINQEKNWLRMLKIDACAAAKLKSILS